LLEVLISMFVLFVGLLGVAALIPVGRFAILETSKADRSGACGRAALSEIKVRRMLDPYPWPDDPSVPQWVLADGTDAVDTALAGAFAIDPWGVAENMPANLGGAMSGTVVPRITLWSVPSGSALTLPEAERIFRWHDDLKFSLPEDMEPPPATESNRPRANIDSSGLPDYAGNFSWLLTVVPAAAERNLAVAAKTLYSVSVVVCYRRDFTVNDDSPPVHNGEHTAAVTFLGLGWGGGGVQLDSVVDVRENEWIMLAGGNQCHWYRVVSAGEMLVGGTNVTVLSLVGPDWDTNVAATAVAIDRVVSVYTTTVELE
jgi:hypothetical protein